MSSIYRARQLGRARRPRDEGLEISLLWSKTTDRVKVAVADARLDEQFEFDVAGADALAAFYHPFAFAASRGLSFGDGLRMSTTCSRKAEKEQQCHP